MNIFKIWTWQTHHVLFPLNCVVPFDTLLMFTDQALCFPSSQEERKKRLGPGGLDPVEVFESLPEVRYGDIVTNEHKRRNRGGPNIFHGYMLSI